MRHLVYLGVLIACVIVTLPLEVVMHARVYRRWREVVTVVLPVAAAFLLWDAAATEAGWWTFDRRYVLGVDVVAGLPAEELLFFLVVPVCTLLTFESIRARRPGWFPDRRRPVRTDSSLR